MILSLIKSMIYQETMEKANTAYHLGLDLSDFAKAAAEMVMREKPAASPCASSEAGGALKPFGDGARSCLRAVLVKGNRIFE